MSRQQQNLLLIGAIEDGGIDYLARFRLHARLPCADHPYVRVAVPNRRPQVDEVFDWCRDTWGAYTKLKPDPFGGPDLRRPGSLWSVCKLPSPIWQHAYRGIIVFRVDDAAMLALRFDMTWNKTGMAGQLWKPANPQVLPDQWS